MMRKALVPVVVAALLACAGCAVRRGATPADAIPAGAPRSAPRKPPNPPSVAERPVVAAGSESSPAAPPAAPAPAAGNAPAATVTSADNRAPAPVASAYVFAPQQAVAARPSSVPSGGAPAPEPPARAPGEAAPSQREDATPVRPRGELQLLVVASVPEIASGAIVTVDVMASSSAAVVDAPLHLTFDPNVMAFVDGAPGDFLTQGGSSVVFLADGLNHPGDVAIAAGRVDREQGASGAGLLCRVRLRGVGAGTTPVLVGRAKAWGTQGEELAVLAGGTNVAVN